MTKIIKKLNKNNEEEVEKEDNRTQINADDADFMFLICVYLENLRPIIKISL